MSPWPSSQRGQRTGLLLEVGLTCPLFDTPQPLRLLKLPSTPKARGTGHPLLFAMAVRPRKAPLESLRLLSAWPSESQEDKNGAELEEKSAGRGEWGVGGGLGSPALALGLSSWVSSKQSGPSSHPLPPPPAPHSTGLMCFYLRVASKPK